jgi:LacI family transcriptional regulator
MSLKEIKGITGFSYSTISRVINGKAKEFRISEETVRVILDTAEKLNYRPNILARSLRLRKTMTIGLIVSDIQNPFFGELASRIERLLRQHGYSTILCNTNEIPKNEEFYLQILVDRQVDGIIIAPIHTEEWDYLESLRKETSVVLIDRIFYSTDLPWVTSENTRAAEALTTELLKLGYRRIAFLGGTPETYISSVRYNGYKKAIENSSIKIDKRLMFFKGYSAEAGEEMMEKLLDRGIDFDAVFCVNNMVFFGAMKVVHEYERSHDRTIMMSAFDIGPFSNMFKRPLISANQDLGEISTSAVDLLLDRINDRPRRQNQIIMPISVDKYRL